MASGFAQDHIKRIQYWIALWLAIHKPLIEAVQMHDVLSPVQNVVDASAGGSEKAKPYLCCAIREVVVPAEGGHTNDHVRTNGIIPIHRKAMVDSLLATFVVQRFVKFDFRILQATMLIKTGNGLADAC